MPRSANRSDETEPLRRLPVGAEVVTGGGVRFRVWADANQRVEVVLGRQAWSLLPDGTFMAARRQLGELADLGVTLVELMPLAESPGQFGWGYDGVNFFATNRHYGEPDDAAPFRRWKRML